MRFSVAVILLYALFKLPSAYAIDRRSILKIFGLSAGGIFGVERPQPVAAIVPAVRVAGTADPAILALRATQLMKFHDVPSAFFAPASMVFKPGDEAALRARLDAEMPGDERQKVAAYIARTHQNIGERLAGRDAPRKPVELIQSLARSSSTTVQKRRMVGEVIRLLEDVESKMAERFNISHTDVFARLNAIFDIDWLISESLSGRLGGFASRLDVSDEFVKIYFATLAEVLPDTADDQAKRYWTSMHPLYERAASDAAATQLGFSQTSHGGYEDGALRLGLDKDRDFPRFAISDLPWVRWEPSASALTGGNYELFEYPAEVIAERYVVALEQIEVARAAVAAMPNSSTKLELTKGFERLESELRTDITEFPRRVRNLRSAVRLQTQITLEAYGQGEGLTKSSELIAEHAGHLDVATVARWHSVFSAALRASTLAHASELISTLMTPASEVEAACAERLLAETDAPATLTHQPMSTVGDLVERASEPVHEIQTPR